jgi:hypothetical protein
LREWLFSPPRSGTEVRAHAALFFPLRAHAAGSWRVFFGLKPDFSCFCTSCDIQRRQRLVVALGGYGGSEDPSWKHQTYRQYAHFALPGIRDAYGTILEGQSRGLTNSAFCGCRPSHLRSQYPQSPRPSHLRVDFTAICSNGYFCRVMAARVYCRSQTDFDG